MRFTVIALTMAIFTAAGPAKTALSQTSGAISQNMGFFFSGEFNREGRYCKVSLDLENRLPAEITELYVEATVEAGQNSFTHNFQWRYLDSGQRRQSTNSVDMWCSSNVNITIRRVVSCVLNNERIPDCGLAFRRSDNQILVMAKKADVAFRLN